MSASFRSSDAASAPSYAWTSALQARLIDNAIPAALFLFGMVLLFNEMIWNGVHESFGDGGDGLILLATLEHWFRLFGGRSVVGIWSQIGDFYPVPNTLGMTDTYFLYGALYSLLRSLGLSMFSAYDVVIGTLATLGYWGFIALARRWNGAVKPFASIAAFVFAFGCMPMFKLGHAQTYSIMLAPILGLLLLSAWRARDSIRGVAAASAAGLLTGLMLFTAGQTPWFLGFVFGAMVLIWLVLTRPPLAPLLHRRIGLMIGFLAGFAVGFIPSAMLYLGNPRRPFPEISALLPHPDDIFQIPPGNFLWYDTMRKLGVSGHPDRIAEFALGYTPIFLITVIVGILTLHLAARASRRIDLWDNVARACFGSALFCWLVELNYWGTRPWWLVWRFVPGGAMNRDPFRIQLATLFFLCLTLAHVASRTMEAARVAAAGGPPSSARFNPRLGGPTGALMLLGGALALIVVEQIGPLGGMRNNAWVSSWLYQAHRPTFPCKAFYILPSPGTHIPWFEQQSDAMMLSQRIGMPTLNGDSSYWPPGWHLNDPAATDYPGHVLDWIRINHLEGQVCGVEPRAGRWVAGTEALKPAH